MENNHREGPKQDASIFDGLVPSGSFSVVLDPNTGSVRKGRSRREGWGF